MELIFRLASLADGSQKSIDEAQSCIDIYTPYVLGTNISFEIIVPTREEYHERMQHCIQTKPWLLAEEISDEKEHKIVGFAYASPYGTRHGYQWAAETSIYISEEYKGKGVGRFLYDALLSILRMLKYRYVMAATVSGNTPSVAFHHRFGFTNRGVASRVGYKPGFGWIDVQYLELLLTGQEDDGDECEPSAPLLFTDDSVRLMIKDYITRIYNTTTCVPRSSLN